MMPGFPKIELAYLAGIMDGEGSIGCYYYPNSKYYKVGVHVVNTHKGTLLSFKRLFGGFIHQHRGQRLGKKKVYTWTPESHGIQKCLRALIPYLRIKQERAVIALQLRDEIYDSKRQVNTKLRNNLVNQYRRLSK